MPIEFVAALPEPGYDKLLELIEARDPWVVGKRK